MKRLLSDVPVRSGYLELGAGYDQTAGGWARAEAGARLLPNLGLFGVAQASSSQGVSAGAGARFTFDI